MRKKRNLFFITIALLILGCKQEQKKTHVEIKELSEYPSASGIEYFHKKIYTIGDDANNLLVLDTSLNIIDSIPLYSFPEKRIPKLVKADLEAIAVTIEGKLLLMGSGSLSPYRNMAWLIDPATRQKDSVRIDTFYRRLRSYNINEINIEGITALRGSFILSNRGNKSFRKNHLIFTENNFWNRQSAAKINSALVGFNNDSSSFSGVSGMAYTKSDMLILTVSTEDTRNSQDDGAIGKSYLWIINNISSKRRWKAINPDKIIDLDDTDPLFKGHKIESVCIIKETRNQLHLLLTAENDNGSSSLFKLVVSKD